MPDLLLRGGRLWGHDAPADVLVRAGVIDQVGPDLRADPAAEVVDVAGRLLLPGLVEAHCHLDKTLFGRRWVPHSAGPALADRIAEERRRRPELGLPNVEHMTALVERMLISGTTYIRTHTDVVTDHGLAGVDAVRAVQERMGDRVTIEQVAFPQYGLLTEAGTADLLEAALRGGVEVVGGIDPAGADRDPVRHLDTVFALAERHGAGIDIHLHDGGSLGVWQLELIIERTKATGLGGRVAVSHAYGLAQADQATQDRIGERLADAGVALVTAAVYDFPVPPIARLRAAGVTIACGHDGIRDLWSPFGSGDMLERAMHVAYRSNFRRDEEIELALEAATYGGARALGIAAYGLEPGARADIVVVDADTPAAAVVTSPVRHLVVKAGRVVARDGALAG
jgi:cytosine deaminase